MLCPAFHLSQQFLLNWSMLTLSSCGDFVSYWASIASLLSIPLTIITILIARSISQHIQDSRFSNRLTGVVTKLRESQRSGNISRVRDDLNIFLNAIELHYSWFERIYNKRVRKLYAAVYAQSIAQTPSIPLIEGLLLNFKTIHAENIT